MFFPCLKFLIENYLNLLKTDRNLIGMNGIYQNQNSLLRMIQKQEDFSRIST